MHWSARSFLLMLLVLVAVPGLAVGQAREPDPDRGEVLVQARCFACHQERSIPFLVAHCIEERGLTYLGTFLERHHAPDAEARADISAFLTCKPELAPPE